MSSGIQSTIDVLIGAAIALAAVPAVIAVLRAFRHERSNFEGKRLANSGGLALLIPLLIVLVSGAVRDPSAPAASAHAGTRTAGLHSPGSGPAHLADHAWGMAVVMALAFGFALLGLADDVWGDRSAGGLRGHFRLLAQGRVTTGVVKALGGAALALAVAAGEAWPPPAALSGWVARVILRAALIALTANAINLLDLRPLRALKGFAVPGLALLFWGAGSTAEPAAFVALAALLGASAVYAPFEARRVVMLGDAGANLLGAVLGLAAGRLPLPAQGAWLAAVAVLHLYAERASISGWIDAHPWARSIDGWGWRGRGGGV
jgi:UDP-GlcNAc:undecaprenyl-phosphate/decaprenyl-phosphate GlcNAc-1-phosphate transferase